MDLPKFEEYKKKLLAKYKQAGYLETGDLKNEEITKEQIEEIFDWIYSNDIEVLEPFQVYARNNFTTVEEKVTFCYYVFICAFLGLEIDTSDYDEKLISFQKGVVDLYLETEFKESTLKHIRKRFGLDDGEVYMDQGNLFDALNYRSLNKFAKNTQQIYLKMRPEYRYHYCLENMLFATANAYYNVKYNHNEKPWGDNTMALMLKPYKIDEGTGVGGSVTVWDEGPGTTWSEGTRMIGWVEGSNYLHFLHFNKPDWWFFTYLNSTNPCVTMEYKEGELSFGMHYREIGYHGNKYIIKLGKLAAIEKYDKGKLISSTTLDFVLDANLEGVCDFKAIDKTPVYRDEDEEKNIIFRSDMNKDGFTFETKTLYKNGDTLTGIMTSDGFSGTVLKHRGFEDDFIYQKYENGEPVKGSPQVVVHNESFPQQLLLIFNNSEGHRCVITYNPTNMLNELEFFEYAEEGKEPTNTANLSSPFFKKSLSKYVPPVDNEDPEIQLNKLIGLESVKTQLARLKAILRKEKNKQRINLNMVFSGNPGTGKTVVARLLGKILHKEGILPTTRFVEVDRSMIVGRYLGETENKVKDMIESAIGGVIFIDEAYALYSSDGDNTDYGARALDTFVKAMEDYRGRICFIFAGYKTPMLKMMSMNQGFKSRVNRFIEFPNYSVDELKQIGKIMVADNQYELEDGVIDEIVKILEPRLEDEDFANARDMRNVLETLYEIQALRTYDDVENYLITMDDVKTYEKDINFKPKSRQAKQFIFLDQIESQRELLGNVAINSKYMQEASVNIKVLTEDGLSGEGSGFFITNDGLIGTCAHVVKGATGFNVIVNIFTDKETKITKTYDAVLVGMDEKADVALIKISNPDMKFTYYRLADKDYVPEPLTDVAMAGYPLGGERFKDISINEGKVQSYNKDAHMGEDESEIDRIYVDLTGHSGNSGSGLVDIKSNQCIGVYAGGSLGYSGPVVIKMNYAIPVKYLWDLIESLTGK